MLKIRLKLCRYELMQSCWQADANERPEFADIRLQLDQILGRNADNYGYIPFIVENIDDNSEIEHAKL